MLASILHIVLLVLKCIAAVAITCLSLFGLTYLASGHEKRIILRDNFKRFGHRMGLFNSRVILTLFYIIVITPYAIVMNAFIDPMRMKTRQTWIPRKTSDVALDDARKQF
ncbi:MAG: SxtJ family membrane protein [Candidatus Hydrogenedentota bacterium]